jgi:hypothetical protein
MPNRLVPLHADAEPVISGGPQEDPLDLIGHLNELREQRISALEEVIAARWPRRWLLSLRLGGAASGGASTATAGLGNRGTTAVPPG